MTEAIFLSLAISHASSQQMVCQCHSWRRHVSLFPKPRRLVEIQNLNAFREQQNVSYTRTRKS